MTEYRTNGCMPFCHGGLHEEDCVAARLRAAQAEVITGVRAWCAINEIASPPLDWEGLGEFLNRVERGPHE